MTNLTNEEKKYYAYFRQIHSLKRYLIFPILSLILSYAVVKECSWLTMGLFFIWITRVIMTRQKQLVLSCLLSVIVSACFFYVTRPDDVSIMEGERSWQTVLQPETLTIKGDYLQFDAKMPGMKGSSRYSYRLKTENEKQVFQKITTQMKVIVTGESSVPKGPQNLNGFDKQRYLAEQAIYQLVEVTDLSLIGKDRSFSFINCCRSLRAKLQHYVDQSFGYYSRLYIKSLLLGYKGEEFNNERESFETLGILYLFSIAGMHVTFFAGLWQAVLKRTPLALEWIYALEYVYLFMLYFIFGEGIAVLRALLSYLIITRNKRFYLGFSTLDGWALSLLFSWLLKPQAILSTGSIYSFFLTLCLVYLRPALSKWCQSKWAYNLGISLGLSILSFPLNAYYFYENRLLAFFFSFLLLPIICQIILPLVVISLVVPFFATPIEFGFKSLQQLMGLLGKMPNMNVLTGSIPVILLVASLVGLCWLLSQLARSWKKNLGYSLVIIGCLSLFKYTNYLGIVAFVNVGQGDCLVIQQPFHGKVLVIDVGGKMLYEKEAWQQSRVTPGVDYTLLPFLKSRGINKIDVLACTHADDDHVGDLAEVLKKVKVERLVFAKGLEDNVSFAKKIQPFANKVDFQSVLAGDQFKLGSLLFQVVSPTKVEDGGNNDSLVLATKIGQARFLFTGDMEKEGEQALMQRYPNLKVDVLKVGHHGSKTSSSAPFIQALQPRLAIISCGENNRFGHPHQETLDTLQTNHVTVRRTDQEGMLYFYWSGLSNQLRELDSMNE